GRRAKKEGSAGALPSRTSTTDGLELEARAQLEEPLLSALEVAGELRRLAERRQRLVRDVHAGVRVVRQVEALGDQLGTEPAAQLEALGQTHVELEEARAAAAVEGR